MGYNLKDFLNGATVIPFEDDILSGLETICQAYAEDEEPLSVIDEMSSYLYADVFLRSFLSFTRKYIRSVNQRY